ncbi:glycosyltransferase [Salinibacter sp.]|uniref:glycosyltransferase n=1 Tax=Salinibacter sp. TaxID=2065818 RepID=UPI0021E8FA52|nr:glycosyltransferase [Salinibacter sp.]
MHYAPTRGIFFQEQVEALHDCGVRMGVIYPNFRGLRSVSLDGDVFRDHFQTSFSVESDVPVYRFHGWNPRIEWIHKCAFCKESQRLMRLYVKNHGQPDLIHAHSTVWGGVAAQELSNMYDIPYVITEHSTAFQRGKIDEWQKPYIRTSCEDADAVWAVSTSLKQELDTYVGKSNIGVIPNMVDTNSFRLPPQERPNSPFAFLSVGGLTRRKGLDILLRAFQKVKVRHSDIRLDIVGDGPRQESLKRLANILDIQTSVHFHGQLPKEGVRNMMWQSNALVSTSYTETFGVVLIEAIATGIPVIATESGGPQDIITDKVGQLVNVGDVVSVCKAMEDVMASVKNSSIYNKNYIRQYAVDNYGKKEISKRITKKYRYII